jgi:hypothetical protein
MKPCPRVGEAWRLGATWCHGSADVWSHTDGRRPGRGPNNETDVAAVFLVFFVLVSHAGRITSAERFAEAAKRPVTCYATMGSRFDVTMNAPCTPPRLQYPEDNP